MIPVEAAAAMLGDPQFEGDLGVVRAAMVEARRGQAIELDPEIRDRLWTFVETVVASVERWAPGDAALLQVAAVAAEISHALLLTSPGGSVTRNRVRTALLYELAEQPMAATALADPGLGPALMSEYVGRTGLFGSLRGSPTDPEDHDGNEVLNGSIVLTALADSAWDLAKFQHGVNPEFRVPSQDAIRALAEGFELDLGATEVSGHFTAIEKRAARSTVRQVDDELLAKLASANFPPELLKAQQDALEGGMLNSDFDAWSLAAPTGTGKTYLARLLILDSLARNPAGKILYLVPSRALVHQVAADLTRSLGGVDIRVTAVTPQLVALDEEEDETLEIASVLVLTPEKADLLLRIGPDFISGVSLAVVDEAHHIENGVRGILLEQYLWRLGRLLNEHARVIFLSAVAPNIGDLAAWAGDSPGGVVTSSRAGRMRVGVFNPERLGRYLGGVVEYTDGTKVTVLDRGVDRTQERGIPQLVKSVAGDNSVLVVAKGQRTAEKMAEAMVHQLDAHPALAVDMQSPEMLRLDARLEREMYPDVALRRLIQLGIAYHHAGIPPRVRQSLEEAISAGHIRYVFATTTLAEGVNFPFSTVIVQSLVTRDRPQPGRPPSRRVMTPRNFWNIAGRAGRPGFDYEGQVILYGPSIAPQDLQLVLEPYLTPELTALGDVRSAFAKQIERLESQLSSGEIQLDDLADLDLDRTVDPQIRELVSMVRVGLAHASATGLEAPEDFASQSFGATQLGAAQLEVASSLARQQAATLERFYSDAPDGTEELLAQLGLSAETLSRLTDYVHSLEDWQFRRLTRIVLGDHLNVTTAAMTASSVMARMEEASTGGLGILLGDIVGDWCSGAPFLAIRLPGERFRRLEELVSLIYSQVQYALPWGLYGLDRIVETVAADRGRTYSGALRSAAYMIDAGVPSKAALSLTRFGVERVDASRLADAYYATGAQHRQSIFAWLSGLTFDDIAATIRGGDNRRMDPELGSMLETLEID